MFNGCNYIGFTSSAKSNKKIKVFSTSLEEYLPEEFTTATTEELELAMKKAGFAFDAYKKISTSQRANFLEAISEEIDNIGDALIQRAALETGLPEGRLIVERTRTVNQLKLFASVLREGSWVEAVIDTAMADRKPLPKPDLRKMLFPVGPVVVFGAGNFPFAFSTAGSDTASALAAGCPVIVKAHSSHLGTNELVAGAIVKAAQKCNMPDGVFSSLIGEGSSLGQALAKHVAVKAIGFTGSFRAGMALFKTAVYERHEPIPVYAEMSSINPVLLLPKKLEEDEQVASQLAASISLGVGQFCTNPGLLFVIKSDDTKRFVEELSVQLNSFPPARMLNPVICQSYYTNREKIAYAKGVRSLLMGENKKESFQGTPTLLEVNAQDFVLNNELQNEIFGPASLVVWCNDELEVLSAIKALHGQLTGTVFGTVEDLSTYASCVEALREKVGRMIFNGVPTGVEVSHAMIHGGPFPATTDGRATSVGVEAIKRFVRPVCYQDCPEEFLPDALKDSNPLNLMRKVNGRYTKAAVHQLEEV